jgi:hypothetical protein
VLGFIGACGIPAAREAEAGGSRIWGRPVSETLLQRVERGTGA